jgi:hypothetical protein
MFANFNTRGQRGFLFVCLGSSLEQSRRCQKEVVAGRHDVYKSSRAKYRVTVAGTEKVLVNGAEPTPDCLKPMSQAFLR